MKFQTGIIEDASNKLVADTPPKGSKFDGTDGWLQIEVGELRSFDYYDSFKKQDITGKAPASPTFDGGACNNFALEINLNL
jgi:hypothetical protein